MSALFSAEAVSCRAGNRLLVEDASLTLAPGTMTVIVGPNGAGKSTLLKAISGEMAVSAGQIRSFDIPLRQIPAWRLACRRTVMAQSSKMSFPFRVYEVVRLGIEGIGRSRKPGATDDLVEHALATADMLDLAGRDYQTLSGGEQQRVQFARALCQLEAGAALEPFQALFLDEPTASLDLCHQISLLEAVERLKASGKVAILAILHDLNLAARFADRLVVMQAGRIVADGTPAAVLTGETLSRVFRIRLNPPGGGDPGLPVILPQFCSIVAA